MAKAAGRTIHAASSGAVVQAVWVLGRHADTVHMPTLVPTIAHDDVTLYLGDALRILESLPPSSVDAVVTDPPYAIKKIGASERARAAGIDCGEPHCPDRGGCRACCRAQDVALFAESPMLGQQSQNWHAKATHSRGYADNDPRQFQRWCSLWLEECLRVVKPGGHLVAFGGTRTWHRLATAAEDAGFEIRDSLAWLYSSGMPKSLNVQRALASHPAGDEQSQRWAGSGTALKPAFEPIVLGRRPLDGTVADNVMIWDIGPLNLRAVRHSLEAVAFDSSENPSHVRMGRWPGNVHLDQHQAHALRASTGQDPSPYFWVSKPSQKERVTVGEVSHPTVKPLDLMRHLVRLVTPHGGVVLEPFAGSGTTVEACLLEGRRVVAIERDPDYVPLIRQRIARRTEVLSVLSREQTDDVRLF